MSINEKDISNNKEKIVTSVHFLDQLRNVIHKPKAEIKDDGRNHQKDNGLKVKTDENKLKTENNNDINSNNKDEIGQKSDIDNNIKVN